MFAQTQALPSLGKSHTLAGPQLKGKPSTGDVTLRAGLGGSAEEGEGPFPRLLLPCLDTPLQFAPAEGIWLLAAS